MLLVVFTRWKAVRASIFSSQLVNFRVQKVIPRLASLDFDSERLFLHWEWNNRLHRPRLWLWRCGRLRTKMSKELIITSNSRRESVLVLLTSARTQKSFQASPWLWLWLSSARHLGLGCVQRKRSLQRVPFWGSITSFIVCAGRSWAMVLIDIHLPWSIHDKFATRFVSDFYIKKGGFQLARKRCTCWILWPHLDIVQHAVFNMHLGLMILIYWWLMFYQEQESLLIGLFVKCW